MPLVPNNANPSKMPNASLDVRWASSRPSGKIIDTVTVLSGGINGSKLASNKRRA